MDLHLRAIHSSSSPFPCASAEPHPSSQVFCYSPSCPQKLHQQKHTNRSEASRLAGPSTSEEDNLILSISEARFYRFSWPREIFFWLCCIVSAFSFRLLLRWNDDWHAAVRYSPVEPDDLRADFVVVASIDKHYTLVPIFALDPSLSKVVSSFD